MKEYVSKYIVCPFYKCEDGRTIRCEGFCKSCNLQIIFDSKGVQLLHRDVHCKSHEGWKKCPIATVINKQYEGRREA